MPQAANTKHRQTLPWLDFGVFQGAIDGNSRAKKRGGVGGGKSIGDFRGMARGNLDELRVSTVHGHAGNFLFGAKIFVAFAAEIAFAASPIHPGTADVVAYFQMIDGRTFFYDATRDF